MRGAKKPLIGLTYLVTATVFYGLFSILSRIVGYNLPLYYQNVVRAVIATALFGILLLVKRQWKTPTTKDSVIMVIRGIIGVAIFIAFFVAVNTLPVSTTMLIFYSGSTLGGYIVGLTVFSEKITRIKIAALLLAFIGLVIVYRAEVTLDNLSAISLALFSGLGVAVWNTFSKLVADSYSTPQISFIENIVGLFISLVVSLILQEQWIIPGVSGVWGANILLGVFWFVVPFFVITGFYHLEATIGSLVMLTEILFASVFAFFFFGESLTVQTLIGGILIVIAITLPEYTALRKTFLRSTTKKRL